MGAGMLMIFCFHDFLPRTFSKFCGPPLVIWEPPCSKTCFQKLLKTVGALAKPWQLQAKLPWVLAGMLVTFFCHVLLLETFSKFSGPPLGFWEPPCSTTCFKNFLKLLGP